MCYIITFTLPEDIEGNLEGNFEIMSATVIMEFGKIIALTQESENLKLNISKMGIILPLLLNMLPLHPTSKCYL